MNMLLGGQGLAVLASGEFEKAWEGSGTKHVQLSEFLSISLIKDNDKALHVVVAAAAFEWKSSQFKRLYGDVSVFVYNLTCSYALDKDNSLMYKLLLFFLFFHEIATFWLH